MSIYMNTKTNPWSARNISYINGVPFVSFGFWFGGKMKGNRLKVFNELVKNIGTKFVLITQENVEQFEHDIFKFHPAVRYTLKNKKGLSGPHMADYLRIYISYHYGGAYHDIKLRLKSQSISHCWKYFNDSNVWIVGMPNKGGDAGYSNVKKYILKHENLSNQFIFSKDGGWGAPNSKDNRLIGNGAWIARPKTDIFKKVNEFAERQLDKWLGKIVLHPVVNFTRCCQKGEVPGYPIQWAAILGGIFHPYQAVYFSHISREMPRYQFAQYMDESERPKL